MNGITGAAAQNPGTIPYTPAEAADLKATGFGFKEGGVDWDTWINNARTSDDPKTQAQLRELIDLAGGRTDNAAIKEAMARYGAMQQAASPNATAADKQAALRGMEDQLTTAMGRMDIKGKLTAPLDNAAKLLLNDPAYANTEWGQALSNVLGAGKNYASFQWGLAQGIWEGGKSLVTGVVDLAAKVLQYSADNGILGQAGDALRGLTGKMPGWLEAFVPSAKRGEASTDALMAMGKGIGDYLSSKTPADVANDIGDAIGKAWDGLKADHAAARAKGPEAEAEWWGKTIGRVGFEIGATFIPVAGQAGKVSAGVRAADAAVDGARVLDKAADGARLADKVGDGARAGSKSDEMLRLADHIPPPTFQPGVVEAANRIGVSPKLVQSILDTEKPLRPLPETYMTSGSVSSHIDMFRNGAARIQPSAPSGTIGRTETWVMPKQLVDEAVAKAKGDPRELEKLLGLDDGYLGSSPVIVDIDRPINVRVPSGNEFGANNFWRPGGYTHPGGVAEAVIDPVTPGNYSVRNAF